MNEALTNFEKACKKLEECYLTDKEEEAKQEYAKASIDYMEYCMRRPLTSGEKELYRECIYSSMI